MRLLRAQLRPVRLFSSTARGASDGGPAEKYNAFRRQNESDETLRARLLCTSSPQPNTQGHTG